MHPGGVSFQMLVIERLRNNGSRIVDYTISMLNKDWSLFLQVRSHGGQFLRKPNIILITKRDIL